MPCAQTLKNYSSRHRQEGVSLLLALLLLLSGSLVYSVQNHLAFNTSLVVKDAERAQRLSKAKQALIAYSVSYADNYLPGGAGPGHLPCPDRSPIDDGVESNDGPDPPCSRASKLMGRFPRFTYSSDLGSLAQDDAEHRSDMKRIVFYAHRSLKDEQMWYAVSRSHVNNPSNLVVNPSTTGHLTVDSRDDILAVIIDPGPALAMNSGTRPGDDLRAYLEGANADGDFHFTRNSDATISNDLLVSVSRSELMQVVMQRVGVFVADWLSEFSALHCKETSNACYPPAARSNGHCNSALLQGYLPLYQGNCASSLLKNGLVQGIEAKKHWFIRNEWVRYIRYYRDPACEPQASRKCSVRLSVEPLKTLLPDATSADSLAISLINIHVVPVGEAS